MESAKSDRSNDAHKPYIYDNFFFDLTRGHTLGLKITGTLKNDPTKKIDVTQLVKEVLHQIGVTRLGRVTSNLCNTLGNRSVT